MAKTNGTVVALPKKPAFEPKDSTKIKQSIALPDELWLAVLECPCTFPTSAFNTVMLNLIKNPNITSSHLFRADIFYDSENDHSFNPDDAADPYREGLVKHLKTDLQPTKATWPDFLLERTIVRQLIPRNPQLDKPLVQTCHIFRQYSCDGNRTLERTLVLYIPHVLKLEDMPFYHPTVSQLAFLHTWRSNSSTSPGTPTLHEPENSPGTLTLLYRLFPNEQLSTKLERTALKLLQTIHKHGQGQLTGYEKRVHHDQLIPQKRYQDTYTRLKTTYGRYLSENWVEVTDPGKHVFEDIAIAAFLIELWRDMYAAPPPPLQQQQQQQHTLLQPTNISTQETSSSSSSTSTNLPPFPGFIDIGCGNGLLTYILLSEGYEGSGFDARQRKTWTIFPPDIQSQLHQQILVPRIFQTVYQHQQQINNNHNNNNDIDNTDNTEDKVLKPSNNHPNNPHWHSGIFPSSSSSSPSPSPPPQETNPTPTRQRGGGEEEEGKGGKFIISNHADELTAWTPLLAYLNKSSFIAIPCCSHDLSGARFRAPEATATCIARRRAEVAAKRGEKKGMTTTTRTMTTTNKNNSDACSNNVNRNLHDCNDGNGKEVDSSLAYVEEERLPQQQQPSSAGAAGGGAAGNDEEEQEDTVAGAEKLQRKNDITLTQAAETGSLKKTLVQKKMASAYSTLCAYVNSLAEEMGFETESDVLRIPSTRNTCIVGKWQKNETKDHLEERFDKVAELVARELKKDIKSVAEEWIERAEKLMKKPSSGH